VACNLHRHGDMPRPLPTIDPTELETVQGGALVPMTFAEYLLGVRRAEGRSLWKFWTWLRPTRGEMQHRYLHSRPRHEPEYIQF
jgi:hypothetical protein